LANKFLLGEYKQPVQRTNKRDDEKVLLQKESFRRTLLLLIEGVFAEEEPDLSTEILDMYHHCPLVFKDYLRLSDNVIPMMKLRPGNSPWVLIGISDLGVC
jgi:hypothetical protein